MLFWRKNVMPDVYWAKPEGVKTVYRAFMEKQIELEKLPKKRGGGDT